MRVQRLDHYSIRTTDLEATRRFYTEVVGLRAGPRPEFPFPGLWLYTSEEEMRANHAVVHVVGIDPNDPAGLVQYLGDRDVASLEGGGAVDHVAFWCSDLPALRERLGRVGIAFRERTVPTLDLHQVFLEDPSGVTLELNFSAGELVAA
ncbi:MAG: VOC family protein [Pseudomonadota bacterium]|jgi:catechol 2,3-dioxygenase-like lactoylglutathione lyase family enzyme